MNKRRLTDGTGRWFDEDAANRFYSDTFMCGITMVCRATGLPYLWETVYLTKYGSFVLVRAYDDSGPESDSVLEIGVAAAVQWLIENGHQEDIKKLDLASEEGQLEI
jgi:hypothetical protein